jgi:2-amino-4-hydroxy-6-hydroxymethyldihydropteridine diphosphokinase
VYLSLGSNLGQRDFFLREACRRLELAGLNICRFSSIYETKPEGNENQPDFLNMVVEVETELPPEKLLQLIQLIEKELGRKRVEKWEPRVIDIDILFYDELELKSDSLTIPHPFALKRLFVLVPLCELEPAFAKAASLELQAKLKKPRGISYWGKLDF